MFTAASVARWVLGSEDVSADQTGGPALSWIQQPAAYIQTVADEDASGDLSSAYNQVRNGDGTLDNIMSIHSIDPSAMRHHHSLYTHACRDSSPLSRVERELVGVSVSTYNGCRY